MIEWLLFRAQIFAVLHFTKTATTDGREFQRDCNLGHRDCVLSYRAVKTMIIITLFENL